MPSLVCVQITLPPAAREGQPWLEDVVEDALWASSPAGVERQDAETWSELVEDPIPRNDGDIRWRLYFDGDGDDRLGHATRAVEQVVGDLPVSLDAWRIDDLSFLDRWREYFKPARVSERIMVHPPWEVPEVDDAVLVCIDPGMAFGTGTHETTRVCLRALDVAVQAGARSVLDVGTGSAILAIAAAKLGAGPVEAIDNDSVAVAVARENVEHNDLLGAITVSETPISQVVGTFDLVLANILPHVLVAMRDDLLARVAPGGRLVLSGIISRELPGVEAAFIDPSFEPLGAEHMGDWCSYTLRRTT